MGDRRRAFLQMLRECELDDRDGWCDLVEVGARLGLDEQESGRVAMALRWAGLVELRSQQGNEVRTTGAIEREPAVAIFDQRGQHVVYQYNAAGDINFGAVQDRAELVDQMQKLLAEVRRARQAGVLDEESATDAEYQLTKAVQQARKPEPDKGRLLGHLNDAKEVIEGVAAAGAVTTGLVTALTQAAQFVQRLFQ